MTRRQEPDAAVAALLDGLSIVDDEEESLEEKLGLMRALREQSREGGELLDRLLLRRMAEARHAIKGAGEAQAQLKKLVETLMAPPSHYALCLGQETVGGCPRVVVSTAGGTRIVGIGEGVSASDLEIGEQVLLNREQNLVVGRCSIVPPAGGETGEFVRFIDERRLVLRSRDEEVVAIAGPRLGTLKPGDLVLWNRSAGIARERMERSAEHHLFLEETPSDTFDDIGGLEGQIERLLRPLVLHHEQPDIARRYGLKHRGGVILAGPPGTGKTMLARALANWLASRSPSGQSRFMAIKPGQLNSVWYSQSEANVREAFRVAREAAHGASIPVVMFFDEIDATGAARGASLHRVDDRVLQAFMAELDGMEPRHNVMVVAATNRIELLDAALLRPGRLRDDVIEVPRPNRRAGGAILRKHLRPSIPVCANGSDPEAAREALIESTVARMYSEAADGDLATVTFRDGRRRGVKPKDLVSGASIARIVTAACEQACVREATGRGAEGLKLQDLLSAVDDEFRSAVSTLTPRNLASYLTDLPQDADVAAIEPAPRRLARPHRFLRL